MKSGRKSFREPISISIEYSNVCNAWIRESFIWENALQLNGDGRKQNELCGRQQIFRINEHMRKPRCSPIIVEFIVIALRESVRSALKYHNLEFYAEFYLLTIWAAMSAPIPHCLLRFGYVSLLLSLPVLHSTFRFFRCGTETFIVHFLNSSRNKGLIQSWKHYICRTSANVRLLLDFSSLSLSGIFHFFAR